MPRGVRSRSRPSGMATLGSLGKSAAATWAALPMSDKSAAAASHQAPPPPQAMPAVDQHMPNTLKVNCGAAYDLSGTMA